MKHLKEWWTVYLTIIGWLIYFNPSVRPFMEQHWAAAGTLGIIWMAILIATKPPKLISNAIAKIMEKPALPGKEEKK
jgi:hypothetical protein